MLRFDIDRRDQTRQEVLGAHVDRIPSKHTIIL